ncbi:putative manganese transporter [[Clostridium] fimetarium]|uniref:Arsenic efflux protein n=1 Tax=[Clostridium] fimetarium TaxID=99656 RepID=A0A1I0NMY7_9FIRM|nr:putative manganese transporter [[Clostridium] fimetarium]SEW02561.1 hypothetical protein SAMN05421659_103225 [[Clostridium] fimetarium]
MLHVLTDTLIDSIKLFPFLLITYIVMEYLEHRTSSKTRDLIKKSGKFGPAIGGVLGAFPQCGFSAAASNLYAGRVITLGTLISIYLSTSDEMIPVFISEKVSVSIILTIVGIKIVVGMIAGFLIDLIMRRSANAIDINETIGGICEHEHCHCENGILKSALKHTLIIMMYIVLISFALNVLIFFIGQENLGHIILNQPFLGNLIAGMVGLIPNCAASVVITQLYLQGIMSTGSMLAGLLSAAGVGFLVLFKVNYDIKENVKIVAIVYVISVTIGIFVDLIGFVI